MKYEEVILANAEIASFFGLKKLLDYFAQVLT
jgi:hypothetical protein